MAGELKELRLPCAKADNQLLCSSRSDAVIVAKKPLKEHLTCFTQAEHQKNVAIMYLVIELV